MVVFFISLFNLSFFEIEELSTSVITKSLNKAFYLNPSYLNKDKENFLSFSYTNPYKISSLNYFQFQTKFKRFGLLIQNLYYPTYDENRLSLIYGGEIKNFAYGFSPNLYYFKIVNDGDFFLSYHLGFTLDFEKLDFMVSLYNLNKPKIWNEEISEKIVLGTDLKFIKNLIISSFYFKTKDDERFKIGFDFSFNEHLSFGQEFSFLPLVINFKFDLLIKTHFGLFYFLNFHHRLKDTHSFTLYFKW